MRPLRHRRRASGFTLVELLVTLLLIALMAGLAVISLPALVTTADLDEEARRIQLLLELARREATLDYLDYGFRATDDGYEFLRFDDAEQQWLPLPPPLHKRQLPDEIRLQLDIGDGRSNEGEGTGREALERQLAEHLAEKAPPVLILSSGETTPFTITLESTTDDKVKALRADGYSKPSWVANE